MEKPIAYRQFENSVLMDFSDILIEDGIRGGKSKSEAQKQAKRFTARLNPVTNDMMKEIYREYSFGKLPLLLAQNQALQYVVLNFCKDNGLNEEAAEYFLVMHEEMWEEKNGCFSFTHFVENALTSYLQAVCINIHESSPDKSNEEVKNEAMALAEKAQTSEAEMLTKFYNKYRQGECTLVEAVDDTFKELLSKYLKKQGQSSEQLEHIIYELQNNL